MIWFCSALPGRRVADGLILRCRLAALAAGFFWSLGGVFIKLLTASPAGGVSAWGITCYRSLVAGLVLLPLAMRFRPPRARDLSVSILLYTVLLSLYVASTQATTAANAIFLQYTAPFYVMLLGPIFFHEPRRRGDYLSLGVALPGVAILIAGNWGGGDMVGLLLGAGSGAAFGFFLLWMRRMKEEDPAAITAYNNLGVAAVSAAAMLLLRIPGLDLALQVAGGEAAWQPLALLIMMGVLQIAVPYVLFSWALRCLTAMEAALLSLVEPLLNPIWVFFFAGERPSAATLAGGVIVLAAITCRYTLFRDALAPCPDQPATMLSSRPGT